MRTVFRPKHDEEYFFVDSDVSVGSDFWDDCRPSCERRYSYGNCFETYEHAAQYLQEVMNILESEL